MNKNVLLYVALLLLELIVKPNGYCRDYDYIVSIGNWSQPAIGPYPSYSYGGSTSFYKESSMPSNAVIKNPNIYVIFDDTQALSTSNTTLDFIFNDTDRRNLHKTTSPYSVEGEYPLSISSGTPIKDSKYQLEVKTCIFNNFCTGTTLENWTVRATYNCGTLDPFCNGGNYSCLTINKAGTGSGTVNKSLAGEPFNGCLDAYAPTDTVTLTASQNLDSIFTGWSGGGCSGTGPCSVTMNSSKTVTATFSKLINLTVVKGSTGEGTVSGADISCGTGCTTQTSSYPPGTQVTLSAASLNCSTFSGWSGGGCSGTGACVVTLNADTTVTANFPKVLPVANFSASSTSLQIPAGVNFSDGSTCGELWSWNFGDSRYDSTSTLQNPVHWYRSPGAYTVSLTASNKNKDGSLNNNTITRTGYITANPCPNLPVKIVGKSSYTTLQAAYNAAVNGDVIQSHAIDFLENLATNRLISVIMQGGYKCDYSNSTNPDISIIKGAPVISNGTVQMYDFFVNN